MNGISDFPLAWDPLFIAHLTVTSSPEHIQSEWDKGYDVYKDYLMVVISFFIFLYLLFVIY